MAYRKAEQMMEMKICSASDDLLLYTEFRKDDGLLDPPLCLVDQLPYFLKILNVTSEV